MSGLCRLLLAYLFPALLLHGEFQRGRPPLPLPASRERGLARGSPGGARSWFAAGACFLEGCGAHTQTPFSS